MTVRDDLKPGVDGILRSRSPVLLLAFPGLVFLLLIGICLWSWVSWIEIVSPIQGKLLPAGRVKDIKAPAAALVSDILISNQDEVSEGQPLISFLDTSAKTALETSRGDLLIEEQTIWRLNTLQSMLDGGLDSPLPSVGETASPTKLAQYQVLLRQWDALISKVRQIDSETEKLLRSINRSEREVERIEVNLPFHRDTFDRHERLFALRAVSRQELADSLQKLRDAEESLQVEHRKKLESEAEHSVKSDARGLAIDDFERDLALELAEAKAKVATLRQDIINKELDLDQQILRAPVGGIVNELSVFTVGGAVQAGDLLMKIVPKQRELEVEADATNGEIGFIRLNQPVRVKVDAFQFTKYGYIEGEVSKISPDVVLDPEKGPVYKITVKLSRTTMNIDGTEINLTPGMTASVDIETGRRRVAEFIIAPFLRYRDEAMRER